jgi:NAD(P)-dependent dehydrogenase (short-subunit alcohol dehydrogenase family)
VFGGIMDITNKVALVTGAGSGIGRASAIRLAREGASVVVADIDAPGGQETVRMIGEAGGNANFVTADVTIPDHVQAMIDRAERTFGGLDILHSNAGIITGPPRWPDTEPERWIRMLDINLRGVILGTQLAIPALRKRGGGAIVNTASMAGVGAGYPPNPVYAASKGGVVLFTASLAPLKDEANIRVNCVCPGVVDTPMLRRAADDIGITERQVRADFLRNIPVLQPEEIADAVVELIRDDSLAGRAMLIRNGVPRELLRLPGYPLAGPAPDP